MTSANVDHRSWLPSSHSYLQGTRLLTGENLRMNFNNGSGSLTRRRERGGPHGHQHRAPWPRDAFWESVGPDVDAEDVNPGFAFCTRNRIRNVSKACEIISHLPIITLRHPPPPIPIFLLNIGTVYFLTPGASEARHQFILEFF